MRFECQKLCNSIEQKKCFRDKFSGFHYNSYKVGKLFKDTVYLFRAAWCMKIFSPNFILSVSFIPGLPQQADPGS